MKGAKGPREVAGLGWQISLTSTDTSADPLICVIFVCVCACVCEEEALRTTHANTTAAWMDGTAHTHTHTPLQATQR